MSLSAYQQAVRSKPDVDFIEALDVDQGSLTYNLRLPLRDPLWFIRAITIVSKQNLQWELMLFQSAVNVDGTIEGQQFNSVWQFGTLLPGPPASPGYPFGVPDISPSPDLFNYYVDGNSIPYTDLDALKQRNRYANVPLGAPPAPGNADPNSASLHVRLINRSAAAKLAGADGALQVTFYCANQGQQV